MKLGELRYDCKRFLTKYFHAPLRRSKVHLFKDSAKGIVIQKEKKTSVVEVNRNILAKLVSWSAKTGKALNFHEALKYPLSPVPLSIPFPDGTKRSTSKSKLMEIIKFTEETKLPSTVTSYIVDIMALIRTLAVQTLIF